MAKVAKALRALQVDVKLIPDMDVLNNDTVFRGIVEAFDIPWDTVQRDYNVIIDNLRGTKEQFKRAEIRGIIEPILDNSSGEYLTDKEIGCIRSAISTVSKLKSIKDYGDAAIPAGDAKNAFNQLNDTLRKNNIFLVPVGELESFVKEVGGHGPEWVNEVLEKYPNFDDAVYDKIKDFVGSINL